MRIFADLKNFFHDPKRAWWVGAASSAAVGALCFLASAKSVHSDANMRFANTALSAKYAIEGGLKSYTDVLRTTANMLQTMDVDARQFHDFVRRLDLERNYPGVESMNFAVRVEGQDRVEFDRRVGAATAASIPVLPSRKGAEGLVLAFLEPARLARPEVGSRILDDPEIDRAVLESRDTGAMAISGRPIKFLSGPNRTGLAMRIPIYRLGAPLTTMSERRAAYIGSIGIGFYVNTLVLGALKVAPLRKIRVSVVDPGLARVAGDASQAPGRLLFDTDGDEQRPAPPLAVGSDAVSTTLPVDYNGRTWNVTFSTNKGALYSPFDKRLPWIAFMGGFGGSLLLWALIRSLLTARERAVKLAAGMTSAFRDSEARLQLSHQKLRQLASHADQIKERERKRIAREIHDDLGQNLLALRIEADMLAARTRERHPILHARLVNTVGQIDFTIKSVRQIINDLRPNVLDLGLSAAVEWQIGEFRRRTKMDCELADHHDETPLDEYCAMAFFRILQQILSNIEKHADANKVWIALERDADCLSLTVRDDGIGLPAHGASKAGAFGLVDIEERMALLGGSFSIDSQPQGGTSIRVSVPVRARDAVYGRHAMAGVDATDD